MKMKKGQAAMEFLMTYGWAILVVLAAIAALAYFGVLSPDRFLPNKCQMPSGIGCVDFVADSNAGSSGVITLVLQNGAGFDANVMNLTINGCGAPVQGNITEESLTGTDISQGRWINGKKAFAVFGCSPGELVSGTKFQGEIDFQYNTSNGLVKSTVGDLVVKVE